MVEKSKIKSVFGIIHPFYTAGYTPLEESKELLMKWKDLVDRVAHDPSAALVINYISENPLTKKELFQDQLQKELIDYTRHRVPENRLLLDKEPKKTQEDVQFNKEGIRQKFAGKLSKNARLFLGGEYLNACVQDGGKILAKEAKIRKTALMPDQSVLFANLFRGNLTPSRMRKIDINDKKQLFKNVRTDYKRNYGKVLIPTNQRLQNKLDNKRGFSSLPREQWPKKKLFVRRK